MNKMVEMRNGIINGGERPNFRIGNYFFINK